MLLTNCADAIRAKSGSETAPYADEPAVETAPPCDVVSTLDAFIVPDYRFGHRRFWAGSATPAALARRMIS